MEEDLIQAFWEEKVAAPLIDGLAKTQDIEFCKARGDALFEEKSYENALIHYHAALKINPKDAWLLNKRAVTFCRLKNFEKALLDYTEAIALEPDSAFFYNRGLLLKELKRVEEAASDFMKALELNPWNEDVMSLIISLRLKEKINIPYF